MGTQCAGLVSALALALPTTAQDTAADAETRARVEVVNLLLSHESADDFFAQGVAARDREEIAPALIAFLTAHRIDPGRSDAPFEIARLMTAWDEPDLGFDWLERAVAAGFWSEDRLQRDGAIAPLRSRAGFESLLERTRGNYQEALPRLRGLTEVRVPEGEAPEGGWPVLLCLHGYGTDHRDLAGVAEIGAAQGFFAISVCGYQPIAPGRYAWPNQGPEIRAYVADVLARYEGDARCDTGRVYTTGFSQGGLVATFLVAAEPERYRGALPISPAGPLAVPDPLSDPGSGGARPLYVLYGESEGAGVHRNVRRFQAAFESVGASVQVESHPGGHTFPANWSEVVTRGLEFLRSGG